MVLIHLKENLSAQFIILTIDNQSLTCSHGRDRWLDLSRFGNLPRNIVDGKYGGWKQGQGNWGLLQGGDYNELPQNPHWWEGKRSQEEMGGRQMAEIYGMVLLGYISTSELKGGWWGKRAILFALLNLVQFLIVAISRIGEKMAEMESRRESVTEDKWSRNLVKELRGHLCCCPWLQKA